MRLTRVHLCATMIRAMLTFSEQRLLSVGSAVLTGLGTPADLAALVSRALVDANLAGHDSHGIIRLMQYANYVRAGQVQPAERPHVATRDGATAVVDGAFGWGQVAAQLGAQTAMAVAAELGAGVVAVARCNHLGRLGDYVETMARAGFVGMAMSNIDRSVAPYGGRTRMLGTNPVAYAAPRGPGHDPIVVDFATSVLAEGKLRVARAKGETVPPGVILDKDGRPTEDPNDFYAGGALRTFGLHKGYGISMMCEVIGGGLSAMAPSCLPEYGGGNGTVMIAMKVGAFVPPDQFAAQADRLCDAVKAAPAMAGVDEVLIPGEPELRARSARLRDGVQLPESTWSEIQTLARELGVTLPT